MGLGREHAGDGLRRHVRQQAVVQRAGEVEHALERLLHVGDAAAHVGLDRDVALDQVDFDSLSHVQQSRGLPQPVLAAAAFGVAVHQGEMARASGDQVGQEPLAEAAEAAGHEIGRIGVQQRPPVVDREVRMLGSRRRLQHQLPLVLAVGHQAERLRIVAIGEHGDRQRRHHAAIEQVEAGLGELARKQRVVHHQASRSMAAKRRFLRKTRRPRALSA